MKEGLKNCRLFVKYFVIAFMTGLISSPLYSVTVSWGQDSQNFDLYAIDRLKVSTLPTDKSLSIERGNFPLSLDEKMDSLYISFDKDQLSLQSGTVLKAEYKVKNFPDSIKEAGSFEYPGHELLVAPADFMFLNKGIQSGDFSIYFRMKVYQQKNTMEIIKKIGYFEGRAQGFRAAWQSEYIYFEFFNFFHGENQVEKKLKISARDKISDTGFHEILLQYKEEDGSLSLYIDRVEQEKIFVTDDKTTRGTILDPGFHRWDNSPLVIGRNFLGALDEMIFSNKVLSLDSYSGKYPEVSRKGVRFEQTPGIAVSKVIELPYSASKVETLTYQASIPEGANVDFYYRYSDKVFNEEESEENLPYQLRMKNFIPFRARYIQWKAELYSDSTGVQTPVLTKVTFSYQDNLPPRPPENLMVVDSENGDNILLAFKRNLEVDVINGGRYLLYYGVRAYEPLGVIKFKELKKSDDGRLLGIPVTDNDIWVTNDVRYQNMLQIFINNELIEKNLVFYRSSPGQLNEYPLLQKKIPYYFWITACDNVWDDKVEHNDHESKPSNYVVIRIH